MTRGWCTNTISDVEFFIDEEHPHSFSGSEDDKKTWWELRPYMVQLPFPSWAALKAYLIKNCKRNNCDKYIASWERRINEMEKKVSEE